MIKVKTVYFHDGFQSINKFNFRSKLYVSLFTSFWDCRNVFSSETTFWKPFARDGDSWNRGGNRWRLLQILNVKLSQDDFLKDDIKKHLFFSRLDCSAFVLESELKNLQRIIQRDLWRDKIRPVDRYLGDEPITFFFIHRTKSREF